MMFSLLLSVLLIMITFTASFVVKNMDDASKLARCEKNRKKHRANIERAKIARMRHEYWGKR